MPGYSGDRREWLLAIGRRLRAEYDAIKEPVPERLAALIKQLEFGNRSYQSSIAGGQCPPSESVAANAAIR